MRAGGEFNGRPFVAGSLTGIRAFKVDAKGRLTGVVYEQPWTPGVNEAVCAGGPILSMMRRLNESLTRGAGIMAPEHAVAGVSCSCGFYGYFKGRNSYMGPGQVAGIVEAYGVCTIGSRGFRAEKARLVALIAPARPRLARVRRAWMAYLRAVRRVVRPPMHRIPHAAARLITSRPLWEPHRRRVARWLNDRCERITDVLTAVLGSLIALSAILALDVWPGFLVWFLGMSAVWSVRAREKPSRLPAVSPAEFDVVRRNYPDVPVYRSRRAAARAHPLTSPGKAVAS